jgi:hypothetical protein
MPEQVLVYDIGAHRILWTPSGGTETDLGLTEDGSVVEIAKDYEDIMVHELSAPVDEVEKKVNCVATVKLVQFTMDNIALALDSTKTTSSGKTSVDVSPKSGRKATFGKLIFRPRDLTSSDKSRDKTMYKAAIQTGFKPDQQATKKRIFDVKFRGLCDQDATTGSWRIFTEGDPTTAVLYAV